jgi:transcriptional repressor NrdR
VKCPKCGFAETKVLESRLTNEGRSVRRRRSCRGCSYRYTTYEREEEFVFNVKKRDDHVEPYDRNKVMRSIQIACQKRPVKFEELDFMLRQIERSILEQGEKTITTVQLGDMLMDSLHGLDKVAYVRFASVYKDFRDPDEFQGILNSLKSSNQSDPS